MIRREYRESSFAFPFVAYLPETLGGKFPLILQLHGAGERGNGGEDLSLVDVHGLPKLMDRDYPCILICPQCPTGSFWAARVESILVFLEQLKETFSVDETRVFLTGLSMGGFGTWYTAMAKPQLFRAIVPVCGGGMAWNAGVLTMPVRVFHGDADPEVSVFHSDDMVKALQKLGRDVTYTRLEGVGHNAWDYAYTSELMDWLLSL